MGAAVQWQWPGVSNAPPCLLVDAGNTRVKAMRVGGGLPAYSWHCPRAQWVQDFGMEQILTDFFEQHPQVRHVAIGSVLGQPLLERLLAWCAGQGLQVFVTTANNHPQLQTCYAQPAQLGQDRWSAALAVALRSQCACNVVLSLGTATTLDAVVRQNAGPESPAPWLHLGGYIVPGPGTMLDAMAQSTAQLPSMPQGSLMQAVWPTNTVQAMGAGVVAMQQQFMLGMAQALSQSHGGVAVQCWVLGGYAQHPAFAALWPSAGVVHWPDAVFFGLYAAWRHQWAGAV